MHCTGYICQLRYSRDKHFFRYLSTINSEPVLIINNYNVLFTSTDIRYFGLYAVGEFLAVNCNSGTATLLQWLDNSGNIVASSNGSSVSLQITPVTDFHNGQVYRCRRYNIDVLLDELILPIISFCEYDQYTNMKRYA